MALVTSMIPATAKQDDAANRAAPTVNATCGGRPARRQVPEDPAIKRSHCSGLCDPFPRRKMRSLQSCHCACALTSGGGFPDHLISSREASKACSDPAGSEERSCATVVRVAAAGRQRPQRLLRARRFGLLHRSRVSTPSGASRRPSPRPAEWALVNTLRTTRNTTPHSRGCRGGAGRRYRHIGRVCRCAPAQISPRPPDLAFRFLQPGP